MKNKTEKIEATEISVEQAANDLIHFWDDCDMTAIYYKCQCGYVGTAIQMGAHLIVCHGDENVR